MNKLATILALVLAGCSAPAARRAPVTTTSADDGGVVLVVFFTTWCPASAEAVRAADAMRRHYASRGLVAYGVDVADTPVEVARFVAKNDIAMPVQRDERGELAKQVDIPTVPALVLMDRRGAVRHVHAGYHGEGDGETVRRELVALLEGR